MASPGHIYASSEDLWVISFYNYTRYDIHLTEILLKLVLNTCQYIILLVMYRYIFWDHLGRDRMVVGFATTYAISAYQQ